ncbi:hypothetical protein CVT25_001984 [Psilocybe cyanescens]|uniref:Uncharacterized protein n=1 Tax=Psilocybe cyanescens TaxID=93625 RepID=A0A409X994_PSICY|nr:hypothetical protein CVT25_001984 [Psilocybe cyanescens]
MNDILTSYPFDLKWGLDIGNYQNDWRPYAYLPEDWNRRDRQEEDNEMKAETHSEEEEAKQH